MSQILFHHSRSFFDSVPPAEVEGAVSHFLIHTVDDKD